MAAQDLCSLSEVRAFLELPQADTGRDTLITNTITPISDAIARYCDREFVATGSATRTFTLPVGHRVLELAPYELRTVTTLRLHPEEAQPETLTATQDYQLLPLPTRFGTYLKVRFSADLTTLHDGDSAKYFGYSQVSIAGAWGMASVPSDVKQAAIIAVASAIRKDIPALDLGDIGLNEPRQLQPDRPVTYALPASSLRMLSPYRRVGMA
jgi:hypothetical protein